MSNLVREILDLLKLQNKSNYCGSQDFLKILTYNIMPLLKFEIATILVASFLILAANDLCSIEI